MPLRNKSVEYRISYHARKRETYIYIGAMWAGRIMHDHSSPLHRAEKYGVFLQLPGMWGPVAYEDNLNAAKLAATAAIKRWLARFTDTPEPPPENLVKTTRTRGAATEPEPETKRVRRTRSAPVVAKRVTRSR